nr:cancer/testis antigen 55-like [Meriones unguiculatus]
MHRLILRLRGFFQRKAEPKEQREQQQRLLGDDTTLENLQGVGSYCDYGCINEHSLFSADVSTGKETLKIEQKVPAVVEEDQTTRRLNTTTGILFNNTVTASRRLLSVSIILLFHTGMYHHTTVILERLYFLPGGNAMKW